MANSLAEALRTAGAVLGTPEAMVLAALSPSITIGDVINPFNPKSRARRMSGRGLLREAGLVGDTNNWGNWLAGLATDVALDPVTWLLPAGTRYLSRAAAKVGPRFPGGLEKLEKIVAEAPQQNYLGVRAGKHLENIKALPTKELRLLTSEIPPGSKALGAGGEALALKTPYGDVLRIDVPERTADGLLSFWGEQRLLPRPNIEGLLQPTRSIGSEAGLAGARVERLPFATIPPSSSAFVQKAYDKAYYGIPKLLKKQGFEADDIAENIGLLGGRPTLVDPGYLVELSSAAVRRPPAGVPPDVFVPPGVPSLARLLGYTKQVRQQTQGIPNRMLAALLGYEALSKGPGYG